MAERSWYSVDISALWGPDDESGLGPALQGSNGDDHETAEPVPSNGSGEPPRADGQTHHNVARLAEAIGANRAGVPQSGAGRHAGRARTSVYPGARRRVYELIAAQNVRLASAEAHISERVTATVEAQTRQLAESLEGTFCAAVEVAESVRCQLAAVGEELARPVGGFVSFQRSCGRRWAGWAISWKSSRPSCRRSAGQLSDLRDEMASGALSRLTAQDG